MNQVGIKKVALAGTGNVAQYIIEELRAYGHDVVVLTRRKKSNQNEIEQRETDYSIPSLVAALEDRDVLISTVSDYTDLSFGTKVHLNMLEALKQSKNCKTFIPSEWTLNVEDYPEQPMFFADANKTLHTALSNASDIKSTVISNGWFADYIVSSKNRYLRDVGKLWPMDYEKKEFTIYGPGTQLVDMTSVRDVARAVAALIASNEPWDHYTYVSGDQISWNDLFALIKKKDPEWKSRTQTLADTINLIASKDNQEANLVGYFEIQSYSGASTFSKEKVQNHRSKYFPKIHFRTLEELWDQAAANPATIL